MYFLCWDISIHGSDIQISCNRLDSTKSECFFKSYSTTLCSAIRSQLVATINCAKNISKRRRSRNTTNGLVILQTLMSPHWTVWEAIIHSFFFQASFSVLGLPKYTKKIHRNSCLQFLSHFASCCFFFLSFEDGAIRYHLDLKSKCFQEGP